MHSHSNSHHGVCGIPEANIASILPTCRRVPRHDDEVHLDADVESNHDVPGLELGFGQVRLSSPPADNVDSERHCQVEECFRHDGKIVDCRLSAYEFRCSCCSSEEHTKSEGVTSRHRDDHQCCQPPDDSVWSQRRAERSSGYPKLGKR